MELNLYTLQKNEKGEWGMWREYYKTEQLVIGQRQTQNKYVI